MKAGDEGIRLRRRSLIGRLARVPSLTFDHYCILRASGVGRRDAWSLAVRWSFLVLSA